MSMPRSENFTVDSLYPAIMGEYEFRCQFLTEKIGKLTEKKGPDRENWDLTEKIRIDREKWD